MSGVWWARHPIPDSHPPVLELIAYADDRQPDAAIVDTVEGDPAEAVAVVRIDAATGRMLGVLVTKVLATKAPPLWYVGFPEHDAQPPAMSLVAFATDDRPDGIVVDADTFTGMPVSSDQQVAAIRWWYQTGQLHQIYVAPTWRRRGLATKLILAAAGVRAAHGWGPLWGGGERTDLGEAYAARSPESFHGRRIPRTSSLPPMTPASEAVGVPSRLLEPDSDN
ncbi:MAG: hypothetical protein QOG53_286 [Frankiales bacterium]|jgi:GNAT superfamily N-acetyltransferase|nr:hypothetical protein [Frankiales bacterium]